MKRWMAATGAAMTLVGLAVWVVARLQVPAVAKISAASSSPELTATKAAGNKQLDGQNFRLVYPDDFSQRSVSLSPGFLEAASLVATSGSATLSRAVTVEVRQMALAQEPGYVARSNRPDQYLRENYKNIVVFTRLTGSDRGGSGAEVTAYLVSGGRLAAISLSGPADTAAADKLRQLVDGFSWK